MSSASIVRELVNAAEIAGHVNITTAQSINALRQCAADSERLLLVRRIALGALTDIEKWAHAERPSDSDFRDLVSGEEFRALQRMARNAIDAIGAA